MVAYPIQNSDRNPSDSITFKTWSTVVLDFLDALIDRDYKTIANLYSPNVIYSSNLLNGNISHCDAVNFWKFILSSPEKPYVRLLMISPTQSKCRFIIIFRHPVTKQCVSMDVNAFFSITNGKIVQQIDHVNKRLFFSHVYGLLGSLLSLVPGALAFFKKQFIRQVFSSGNNRLPVFQA
jgi:hypothetical protein